jgi:hypothetical protein
MGDVGRMEKKSVGAVDGATLGRTEGAALGRTDGATLGMTDGATLGATEGMSLGVSEGTDEGNAEGTSLGKLLGVSDTVASEKRLDSSSELWRRVAATGRTMKPIKARTAMDRMMAGRWNQSVMLLWLGCFEARFYERNRNTRFDRLHLEKSISLSVQSV